MEGYGNVQINIITPTGQYLFLLKQVAFIPGFHTNVISYRRLRQAGYHWDDINLRVQREDSSETVFYMKEVNK
jgi:hypothetical protein